MTDRVGTGPEAFGHRRADDRHGRRISAIGVVEIAAAQQRDAQCREVSGTDGGRIDIAAASAIVQLLIVDKDVLCLHGGPQRHAIGLRHGHDARNGCQPLPQLPGERLARGGGHRRHLQHRHQDDGVLPFESRVDVLRALQAAHEQAGAGQQDERDRELRDDQRIARTEAAIPAKHRRLVVLERRKQPGPRRLQRRSQTEQDAGEHRHHRGKRHDARRRATD